MNKKGFTVIELITSFALASAILVLLLNLLLVVKNIYTKAGLQTQLLIKQANLSKSLNEIITNDNISSYSSCTDASADICYQFNHVNGFSYKLLINSTKKTVTFNNYTYKLDKDSIIGTTSVSKEYVDISNPDDNKSFLVIKIPITNKNFQNKDFGINLVYTYS